MPFTLRSAPAGKVPPVTRPLLPADPRRLGGYELLSRLGAGGMGAVYLGRDANGRLAAVKVIRAEYADDEEFRGRFRSEVNRARQVPPFCTAEVLGADPDHETPYLVVEYVDGPDLADVVAEQGPLTGGSLSSVAVGVATAIAAIHGAGVIHRDLKPRNVLLARSGPKVIDFGIARAVEMTSAHTRTDQMVGTVAYMAPERFDSDTSATGPAADVFAWGAVVTYAGTGRTPFAGETPAVTAAKILTQPPDLTGLPDPLRELVARTLAKDPRERPTAHELLQMLLSSGPVEEETLVHSPELRQAAEAAVRGSAPPRRRRRAPLVAAAVVFTAAAVAGGAAYGMSSSGDGNEPDAALSVAAPAPRQIRGLSVVDRLDRPGQWREVRDEEGTCLFEDGGLELHSDTFGTRDCPGPQENFAGDASIAADVTLLDPGSCALLRFRWTGQTGYLLTVCDKMVQLDLLDEGDATALTSVATEDFMRGNTQRLRVELRGQTATVAAGDKALFQAPITDPALVTGQVILGVAAEEDLEPSRVRFANAEIRSV